MTSVPGWAARYIGLPWRDGGRDFGGVDCEGLGRLLLRHEAGDPPLPAYGIVSADGMLAVARAIAENAVLPPWRPARRESLRRFDWALMTGRCKVDGVPRSVVAHCGIMLSETLMLHIEQATHSVAVPLDHPVIRGRLAGFVRHEALA